MRRNIFCLRLFLQCVPKPIALEPCFGNRAAVLSIFVRLPRGAGGIPPPGQSGEKLHRLSLSLLAKVRLRFSLMAPSGWGLEGGAAWQKLRPLPPAAPTSSEMFVFAVEELRQTLSQLLHSRPSAPSQERIGGV